MKQIYVNSRLHSLSVGVSAPRDWIFSRGDKWLLLTPPRLRRLAVTLGLRDARVTRLLDEVRRWHPAPEEFCALLGLETSPRIPPEEYPPTVCPLCDHVHCPHPGDADRICPECGERATARRRAPRTREELESARIRNRLQKTNPEMFEGEKLAPGWRMNRQRRLRRDWNGAVNRILLGELYKDVARDVGCSVGVLHRKVSESRYWEWN